MYSYLDEEEFRKLKLRLSENVEKDKSDLIKYLKTKTEIDDTIIYLINELLEDKEHLDVFMTNLI